MDPLTCTHDQESATLTLPSMHLGKDFNRVQICRTHAASSNIRLKATEGYRLTWTIDDTIGLPVRQSVPALTTYRTSFIAALPCQGVRSLSGLQDRQLPRHCGKSDLLLKLVSINQVITCLCMYTCSVSTSFATCPWSLVPLLRYRVPAKNLERRAIMDTVRDLAETESVRCCQ